jgi:hypothetical protein
MTITNIFAAIGMIWVAYHACRIALEWAETSRAIRELDREVLQELRDEAKKERP